MRIGFFDSGIGGITVLHKALKVLSGAAYLYYADQAHVPYGTKTREEITAYVKEAVSFLSAEGCRCVVIACNTATSAAIEELRHTFDIPILGMEPAVKPAVAHAGKKRVLVTATPFTIREEKLHRLIERVDPEHIADLKALPRLVEFAEAGCFDVEEVEDYLKEAFAGLELDQYSEVVLGCTHFAYFRSAFRHVIPADVEIIDGTDGTVRHLKEVVGEQPSDAQAEVTYYISGKRVTDPARLAFYQQLMKQLDRQTD